jgi:hypothetical protein
MVVSLLIQFKKRLVTDTIVEAPCPKCNSVGTMRMFVHQKYVTLFFVPFMPNGKEAVASCQNCHAVYDKAVFTDGLKQSYKKIKKLPLLWMYSGLGIIVAILGFAINTGVEESRATARLVLKPEAGHIYDVKLDDKVFTLLKVTAVKGDSVYLVESQFMSEDYSGFNGLHEKPFRNDAHAVPKKQIKEWYDNGVIRKVTENEE